MDMNRVRKTIAGLSALAVMVSGGFGVVPESAVDFSVTANASGIVDESEEFSITKLPDKTQYAIGENLDMTGAQYDAYYSCVFDDGETTEGCGNFVPVEGSIEDGSITIDDSEFDNTKPGTYKITLIFHGTTGDLTDSFEVTVKEGEASDYTEGTYEALTYRNYGDHIEITDCDETLKYASIPWDIDDIPVTAIGDEAFKDCTKLVSIDMDGYYITSIGRGAFENCESLELIFLSCVIDKISADMFKGCKNLNYLYFDCGVKTIEEDAFSGCENLRRICYDGGNEESWGDVVTGDGNDAVKNADIFFDIDAFYYIVDEGGIALLSVPDKTEYLIGEELDLTGGRFSGSYNRIDLYGSEEHGDIFPTSLDDGIERGAITLDASEFDNTKPGTYTIYIRYDAYDDVESFEVTVKDGENPTEPEVPLGDLDGNDAINATDAAMVLSAAAAVGAGVDSGLTEEQMKAADVDGNGSFDASDASYILAYAAYTGAGGADSLDEFLESLVEPDVPTEPEVPTESDNPIVAQLCYENKGGYIEITGCQTNDITELVIPAEIDGVPVKSIANEAFQQYADLVSVSIADGVTSIGDFAFWNCSGLTSITLPDSIENIGEAAFSNSDRLESIHVSENNKFFKSVDGVLFSKDGTALLVFPMAKTCTSYIIPDGVTTVRGYAFFSCKNLNAVIIPTTVKSVETRAFDCCVNLTDIYYTGTEEEWKEIVIANEGEDEEPPAPVIHYNYVSEIS